MSEHRQDHYDRHQSGGPDALTGILDANARVAVQNGGTLFSTRRIINLIGSGLTIGVADDSANERATITLTVAAAGGAAGGDLTGMYPNPTLAAAGPGATGPIGSATVVPIVTIDAKGRVTGLTSITISGVVPALATPAITLGSAAAAGSAANTIRSDSTIAAFDATVPTTQAIGDAAAIGTAAFAARRDHKHAWPTSIAMADLAAAVVGALIPPGMLLPWPSKTLPTNGLFLWADGVAVSRATYATLFAAIVPVLGTVTVTLASPGVWTCSASHNLAIGDAVYLTTTGALPTGVSANTIYYVMTVPSGTTFTLGTTRSTTAVTIAVNTSVSQSGVHTVRACPFGLGDASTTFNTPKLCGMGIAGLDAFGGASDAGLLSTLNAIGLTVGEESHALITAELGSHTHASAAHTHTMGNHTHTGAAHTHDLYDGNNTLYGAAGGVGDGSNPGHVVAGGAVSMRAASTTPGAGGAPSTNTSDSTTPGATGSTGSGTGHNTMQPTIFMPWVIKT